MKDQNNINRLFSKDNLSKKYIATEEDWLAIRPLVIKKNKDRKLFIIWLFFGLIVGLGISQIETKNDSRLDIASQGVQIDSETDSLIQKKNVTDNQVTKVSTNEIEEASVEKAVVKRKPKDDFSNISNDKQTTILSTANEKIDKDQYSKKSENWKDSFINTSLIKNTTDGDVTFQKEKRLNTRFEKTNTKRKIAKVNVLDVLNIEPSHETHKYCTLETVTPIHRKLKIPIQLSLMGGPRGEVLEIGLQKAVASFRNSSVYTGLKYQLWNEDRLIILQNQQSFTFGLNNKEAQLTADRVHYIGLTLGATHKLWKNVFAFAELSSLYRLNIQGSQSFWVSNNEIQDQRINLQNQHSHNFNASYSIGAHYDFRRLSLGMAYSNLLQSPYVTDSGDGLTKLNGQGVITLKINL